MSELYVPVSQLQSLWLLLGCLRLVIQFILRQVAVQHLQPGCVLLMDALLVSVSRLHNRVLSLCILVDNAHLWGPFSQLSKLELLFLGFGPGPIDLGPQVLLLVVLGGDVPGDLLLLVLIGLDVSLLPVNDLFVVLDGRVLLLDESPHAQFQRLHLAL